MTPRLRAEGRFADGRFPEGNAVASRAGSLARPMGPHRPEAALRAKSAALCAKRSPRRVSAAFGA